MTLDKQLFLPHGAKFPSDGHPVTFLRKKKDCNQGKEEPSDSVRTSENVLLFI